MYSEEEKETYKLNYITVAILKKVEVFHAAITFTLPETTNPLSVDLALN